MINKLMYLLFTLMVIVVIATILQMVIGHKYFCDTILGKVMFLGDD